MEIYGKPTMAPYNPYERGWMEGDPTTIWIADAHPDDAQAIIDAPVEDGSDFQRSAWFWMRFPNGDLLLGCWPQDQAYLYGEERRAV